MDICIIGYDRFMTEWFFCAVKAQFFVVLFNMYVFCFGNLLIRKYIVCFYIICAMVAYSRDTFHEHRNHHIYFFQLIKANANLYNNMYFRNSTIKICWKYFLVYFVYKRVVCHLIARSCWIYKISTILLCVRKTLIYSLFRGEKKYCLIWLIILGNLIVSSVLHRLQ